MNETAPEGETESSLRYYGMGDARWVCWWQEHTDGMFLEVCKYARAQNRSHSGASAPGNREMPRKSGAAEVPGRQWHLSYPGWVGPMRTERQ